MTIYVSNLSFSVTEEELAKLFGTYGEIATVKIPINKLTNRSRGFGFVEMPNEAAAESAIKELNGTQLSERAIQVTVAKPREERPGYDDRRGSNKW